MISKELLKELDEDYDDIKLGNGSSVYILEYMGREAMPRWEEHNIYELVFDKCIEWAWKQGYSITMFRANNIFHARVHGDDIANGERRFYSNPHDKYNSVIQACEWILKRKG